MYGPGQPSPWQGQWQGQQQGGWQGQVPPYQSWQQPQALPGSQPAPPPRQQPAAGPRVRLPVLGTVVVLALTGAVNAALAPISFLHEQFRSLWLVGGDPFFLATAQAVTGVACLAFGVLLLTRQSFAWGGALASVVAFGMLEAYCITRGVAEHFVGLFLVVVAIALLNQSAVRRFCGVGPPAQ